LGHLTRKIAPKMTYNVLSGMLKHKVTTCLENLEISGNLTAVGEMSGILLKIMKMSGKSCQGKVA